MKALRFRITTVAAALAVTITSYGPVQAMPRVAAPSPSVQDVVNEVQYRRDRRDRRDFRRSDRRRDFRRDNRRGYYNGHRGYRERRRGYRYHNGFWFPLAAFATGAIIGGAAQARPGGSHVQWCINRYRSYRTSDNTFQPYNGPRRQCVSPYR